MSRSIIGGVAAMLLTTATALAEPAPSAPVAPAGHQPGEESAVLAALD